MKLEETLGLSLSEKNVFSLRLDNEATWFSNHTPTPSFSEEIKPQSL